MVRVPLCHDREGQVCLHSYLVKAVPKLSIGGFEDSVREGAVAVGTQWGRGRTRRVGGDRGLLRKRKPGCWPTRLQLLVDCEGLLAPEPARSSSGAVGSPGLVLVIGLVFCLGFSWFVGC